LRQVAQIVAGLTKHGSCVGPGPVSKWVSV